MHFEFLIPQLTLLLGAFSILGLETWGRINHKREMDAILVMSLMLAIVQLIFLMKLPPNTVLRGGITTDGVTLTFSLAALVMVLSFFTNHKREQKYQASQAHILTLVLSICALCAIQSSRVSFVVLALISLIWVAGGILGSDRPVLERGRLIYNANISGVVFMLIGTLLTVLLMGMFGETQHLEMWKALFFDQTLAHSQLIQSAQILIMFMCLFFSGVPPFTSLQSRGIKTASWSLSLGITGLFAIIFSALVTRWSFLIFTHYDETQKTFLSTTSIDMKEVLYYLSSTLLAMAGAIILIQKKLRGIILLIMTVPFLQVVLILSCGTRESVNMGISMGLIGAVSAAAFIWITRKMNFDIKANLEDFVGLGRRRPIQTTLFIFFIAAMLGLPPFYGSLIIQKTLRIKPSAWPLICVYMLFAGIFISRMVTLGFKKASPSTKNFSGPQVEVMGWSERILFFNGAALIFLGIFWQPLYKYGEFSIRKLLGE